MLCPYGLFKSYCSPLFVSCILLVSAQPAYGQTNPSDIKLQSQLLAQLAKSWKILKTVDEADGCYRYNIKIKTKSRDKSSTGTIIIHLGEQLLRSDDYVYATNADYSFIISKAVAGWKLSSLSLANDDATQSRLGRSIAGRVAIHPLTHFVDGILCTDLLHVNRMIVSRIEHQPDGLVVVEFSISPTNEKTDKLKSIANVRGSIWLAPANHWLIVNCQLLFPPTEDEPERTSSITRSVSVDSTGRLFCTNYSEKHVSVEISSSMAAVFEETDEKPTKDIFRLTHYGLPEPDLTAPVQKATPVWWWLAVLSGICFVAAVLFRRKQKSK